MVYRMVLYVLILVISLASPGDQHTITSISRTTAGPMSCAVEGELQEQKLRLNPKVHQVAHYCVPVTFNENAPPGAS